MRPMFASKAVNFIENFWRCCCMSKRCCRLLVLCFSFRVSMFTLRLSMFSFTLCMFSFRISMLILCFSFRLSILKPSCSSFASKFIHTRFQTTNVSSNQSETRSKPIRLVQMAFLFVAQGVSLVIVKVVL